VLLLLLLLLLSSLLLLQAELEHTLSFFTFKRLFKAGGYSYLHQVRGGLLQSGPP
jgi:hypothetical protein